MNIPNTSWYVNEDGFRYDITIDKNSHEGQYVIDQILAYLVDEEKGQYFNEYVIIPHNVVSALTREEREELGIPDTFPFSMKITASGILSDRDLHYTLTFMKDNVVPFVNPKRIGAYLHISSDQYYILTQDQYEIVNAIEQHNKFTQNSPQDQLRANFLAFSKIKGLSKRVGAVLDSYLGSEEVIIPHKVSVRLKKIDDGTLEIEPVLLIVNDSVENQQLEDNYNEVHESVNQAFTQLFDRFKEVKAMYPVPDGPRIILGDEHKEALQQVKINRKLSGEEKDLFLKFPHTFLKSNVFFHEDFGSRVLEIGEYKPRVFPFLRPMKESWLPPEGGLVIDGEPITFPSKEIKQLHKAVCEAVTEGKKEIVWKDRLIPTNQETIKALEELTSTGISEERTTQEIFERVRKQGGTKNILIIHDNIVNLSFAIDENPRPGNLGIPGCILPGIKLFPHQEEGISWLQTIWRSGYKGALLADDMGLGKTLQALSFICWVKELMNDASVPQKPVLVVAPVALLENWCEEYRQFFNAEIFGNPIELHGHGLNKFKNLETAAALGIQRETDITNLEVVHNIIQEGRGLLFNPCQLSTAGLVLTTYETLRDYQLSFGLVDWGVIVLDEAQKIKTPTAMMTTAVKAMKYDFGLCLTGTPVENSWVDLWSIMDFVQPGKLGSLKEFNQGYQVPLRKQETDRHSLGSSLLGKLTPLIMRRLKKDQLRGLPNKDIISYDVTMPSEQYESYMGVVQRARDAMPDRLDKSRKQHILQTITMLRDVSLHPYLLTHSEQGFAELPSEQIIKASARLRKTFDILEDIKKCEEKVLIFLVSRKMQRILHRLIEGRFGIDCLRPVNGEVLGTKRKHLVDQFQQKKGFQVLILSPEAAGVGLNIVSANHVIHLSRAWNPAKEDQATDRIYRIGQTRPVTVHLPLAIHPALGEIGAFDQKLHRLLEQKRMLSSSVLLPPAVEEEEMNIFGENLIGECTENGCNQHFITIDNIDQISGLSFERAIARIYEKMGYKVELTPVTNDFGADVIVYPQKPGAHGIVIQCKHTGNPSRPMGPGGVQEVCSAVGVYKRSLNTTFVGMVVTNSVGFSENAQQAAKSNSVQLCDRRDLIKWIAAVTLNIGDLM